MIGEMVLTVSQSKRLIAKGVAAWPPVKDKLANGMIIIAKGTTNRYVAEELLGISLRDVPFAWGLVAPATASRKKQDIPEIVIVDGNRTEMDFEDAVESLSPGDIFVKGGNALHLPSQTVGILSTSAYGGTIGTALPRAIGSRARIILPVGLEKCVATPIDELAPEMNSPDQPRQGLVPTMWAVSGKIFTEIEAIHGLFDVEAYHVASGGVAGCEGSVRLLVRGAEEELERASAFASSLLEEPPYEP